MSPHCVLGGCSHQQQKEPVLAKGRKAAGVSEPPGKQASAARPSSTVLALGSRGGENRGTAGDGLGGCGETQAGAAAEPTNRARLQQPGCRQRALRAGTRRGRWVTPRLWVKTGIWPRLSVARLVPAPALPLTQARIWADGTSASSLIYSHRNTATHHAYGPGICRSILIGIFIKLKTSGLVF